MKEVLITLSFSMAIVVATIWLFMGSLRATLVPAIAIPVSLIGTDRGNLAVWLLHQYPDTACAGALRPDWSWMMPSSSSRIFKDNMRMACVPRSSRCHWYAPGVFCGCRNDGGAGVRVRADLLPAEHRRPVVSRIRHGPGECRHHLKLCRFVAGTHGCGAPRQGQAR